MLFWPIRCGGATLYVDRIFRGAKPDELPVQLPTKFELIINLKTTKELGGWLRAKRPKTDDPLREVLRRTSGNADASIIQCLS